MPSVWRLLPFSSKKKGHHGSKFQEFHSYENQRFPSYPNITQNLAHPQYYQQQQPQQNHVVQQTNTYHNQYQQGHPPPFAFSHRQQHQSQFQQQNTLVQSPQLISTPALTNTLNQCQCQHCVLPNQVAYAHHNQGNINQLVGPPQPIISPPVATPQMQIMNAQLPLQPQSTLPVQSMVSPHQPPQLHHQHQSVPMMQHEHQMAQQPCMQIPHQQHHPPHQQHQITSPLNDMTHQYANQLSDYSAQQASMQCTCHHCPSHQPQRDMAQHNQQYHQTHAPPHIEEPIQQQFSQHSMNITQMNQHTDINQLNNSCQHQMITNQVPHNQLTQQSCGTPYSNTPKGKLCSSQDQNQNTSGLMSSSTPHIQHQELSNQQQQHQQAQCQQQYSNTEAMSVPQFHYHTIQPNQYQQQKQQMTQQQHHQRIQSLHQQVSHSPKLLNDNQISPVIESTTRSYPQVDSRTHEFSRYANVRSIMSESSQSSKYQEHVYYNQKPELPPYQSPPSYSTFIENKNLYIIGMRNHHMTHHSESLVSHKTKDSSYENLRRFSPYGNYNSNRQESGLTT